MANLLTMTSNLSFAGNGVTVVENSAPAPITVTGNGLLSLSSVTVPTAAAAIPLGSITAPGGWIIVKNNDATNYMTLMTGTGGIAFARIYPGEFAHLRLDAGLTAPFWKANVATVQATIAFFDN